MAARQVSANETTVEHKTTGVGGGLNCGARSDDTA